MDQAIIGELVVLASATVLPVKDVMKSRPNIEFGLKIGDLCKAQVHTIWQEKILGEKLVLCHRMKSCWTMASMENPLSWKLNRTKNSLVSCLKPIPSNSSILVQPMFPKCCLLSPHHHPKCCSAGFAHVATSSPRAPSHFIVYIKDSNN